MIGVFILIIASVFLSFLSNSFILQNTLSNNVNQNPTIKAVADLPTSSHKNIEETEKVLIKACREAQAQILICKECYLAGNTYCPYPTDSFCRQVRNLDEDDPKVVWSFLPNNRDYLIKLKTQPEINPLDARSSSDLPKILIYRINHSIDYDILDKSLKYNKPTNTGTDPCAVEGVVDK